MIALARQLRNVGGPTAGQPGSIDRAGPFDLVFQSVNASGTANGQNAASVQRIRYCLGTGAPAVIHMQVQRWTTATGPLVPADAACPGSGWDETRNVATGLSNRQTSPARPMFLYDSVDLPTIDAIRLDLFIDADLNRTPGEVRLESGVFLRNQNRPPVAAFQATPGGPLHVLLNASASSDPEGLPLVHTWKVGAQVVGTGTVLDWSSTPGYHTVTLEVRDPAGLVTTASQSVLVS